MEHLYIISYDISEPKRWRRIFKLMCGYGEWLQLSVFQARLSQSRVLQLEAALRKEMNQDEDHVLMVNIGPVEHVAPKVRSLGKVFEPVTRQAIVV